MCTPAPEAPLDDTVVATHEGNGIVPPPVVVDELAVGEIEPPICPPPTTAVIATFVKDMPVRIDGEVREQTMRELLDTFGDIASEQARQKQAKAKMAEAIAALELRQHSLADALRKGSETRPVDCERVALYDEGIVIERRADTHEELSRRPMKDEERQLPLSADVAERAAAALVQHSTEHEPA